MMRVVGLVLLAAYAGATAPSGSYGGKTQVGGKDLGIYFHANLDGKTFDVTMDGALQIECSQAPTGQGEVYDIKDDGRIDLPNILKDGDCLHDGFSKQDTTFTGMTYNNGARRVASRRAFESEL